MGNSALREGTSYIKALNSFFFFFFRALFTKQELLWKLGGVWYPLLLFSEGKAEQWQPGVGGSQVSEQDWQDWGAIRLQISSHTIPWRKGWLKCTGTGFQKSQLKWYYSWGQLRESLILTFTIKKCLCPWGKLPRWPKPSCSWSIPSFSVPLNTSHRDSKRPLH